MKKFFGPLLTAGTMLALLYTVYGYREQDEKLKSERKKKIARIGDFDTNADTKMDF